MALDIMRNAAGSNMSPQELWSVTAYTVLLRAAAEQAQAQAAERGRASTLAARERLTPLEDRVARLLESIPVELQAKGLSLSALQASLRGRWRGACHPGELGTALRKLGFTRKRRWRGADGFQALWYREYGPPLSNTRRGDLYSIVKASTDLSR